MLTKADIKFVKSLEDKSERYANRQFVAEGSKSVLDLLDSNLIAEVVFADSAWISQFSSRTGNAKLEEVSRRELEQMSRLRNSREVIGLFRIPEITLQLETLHGLIPVLDGIQDPGNLGTLIRVADWYGIPEILCSPDTVDCFNPKVVQSTMGSIGRVKVHYVELQEVLRQASFPVYGASTVGEPARKHQFPKDFFLVLGNEGTGIRPEITRLLGKSIAIERRGKSESLNAALAGAILIDRYFGQY